ncbi:transmembrane protein, putative (macronuclear) [Tetrahymena thermophila SB210]|uniref:Transmembrane protein, putative n=1 Tax=Tetrahymena thermophila (strain SB210) TaxID=312017 RepID=I7M4E4_TETTS|nr:transmembrane protein, putative [Tetrahymena thermophila SB210]EAS06321.2 transmembrane protein, putative [Tetrahymena thermophila SB210]|eukprot:XP_001026566.2 transmembrane protein, putative [Tetrahymena thermophila SB210]
MLKKRLSKLFGINLIFNFLVQYTLQYGQLLESNQLQEGNCDQNVVNQLKVQNLTVYCDPDLQIVVDMRSQSAQNLNLILQNNSLQNSIVFMNTISLSFNQILLDNVYCNNSIIQIKFAEELIVNNFIIKYDGQQQKKSTEPTDILGFYGIKKLLFGNLDIKIEQDNFSVQSYQLILQSKEIQTIQINSLNIQQINPYYFNFVIQPFSNAIIKEINLNFYQAILKEKSQFILISAPVIQVDNINIQSQDLYLKNTNTFSQIQFQDFQNLQISNINVNSYNGGNQQSLLAFTRKNTPNFDQNLEIKVLKIVQASIKSENYQNTIIQVDDSLNKSFQFLFTLIIDQIEVQNSSLQLCSILKVNDLSKVNLNSITISKLNTDKNQIKSILFKFIQSYSLGQLYINSLQIKNMEFQYNDGGLFYLENYKYFSSNNTNFIVNKSIQAFSGSLFNIKNTASVSIQNLFINLSISSSQIRVQFGGFISLINVDNTIIETLNFENDQKVNSVAIVKQGGILYSDIICGSIQLSNIKANNFQISGDGGLAYLQNNYINLNNVEIKNFRANKNGGAFFLGQQESSNICQQPSTFSLNSVFLYNCTSFLTAGAIFGGSVSQVTDVKIYSCQSQLGGGFYLTNFNENTYNQIDFKDNKALLYGQNSMNDVNSVKCINIYEYNPQLGTEMQKVFYDFQQQENLQVKTNQLINGLTYVMEIAIKVDNQLIENLSDLEINTKSNDLSQQIYGTIEQDANQQQDSISNFGIADDISNKLYFGFNVQAAQTDDIFDLNFQFINLTNIQSQFQISIKTNITSQCKIGMIQQQYRYSLFCSYCVDSISLEENPTTSTKCKPCSNDYFSQCYANYSYLKQGFWRESMVVDSNQVQACSIQQSNCIGGDQYGNDVCQEGHVAVECLDCDLYNQRGSGSFYRTNHYSCTQCSQIKYNILKIIALLIAIFIAILIIFANNFRQQTNYIFKKYLSELKIIYLGRSYYRLGQSSSFIRVLSFFFQIINISSYFQSSVYWKNIMSFQQGLFNPVVNTPFSFDCFLVEEFNIDSIIEPKIIIITIFPFIILLISLIPSIVKALYYKKSLKQFQYSASLMVSYGFLTLFCMPVIDILMSGMFCLTLNDGQSYSILDFNIQCHDPSRNKFLFSYILPFFFIYSVVIPGIMFFILYKNRNNLDKIKYRFLLGFLYIDYKDNFYYWEFIRLLIKFILIISIYSFLSSALLMGFVSLSILIIYLMLLQHKKPYVSKKLNNMEFKSVILGCLLLISQMINYSQEQQEIQFNQQKYMFYEVFSSIIIILANILCIVYTIYMIFQIGGSLLLPHLYKIQNNCCYQFIVKYLKIFEYKKYTLRKIKNLQAFRKLVYKISKDSAIDYSHYPLLVSNNGTFNKKKLIDQASMIDDSFDLKKKDNCMHFKNQMDNSSLDFYVN